MSLNTIASFASLSISAIASVVEVVPNLSRRRCIALRSASVLASLNAAERLTLGKFPPCVRQTVPPLMGAFLHRSVRSLALVMAVHRSVACSITLAKRSLASDGKRDRWRGRLQRSKDHREV